MFSYRLHKVFCSNLLCFKKISAKSVIMMSSFSFLILFILSFLISLAVGLLFYWVLQRISFGFINPCLLSILKCLLLAAPPPHPAFCLLFSSGLLCCSVCNFWVECSDPWLSLCPTSDSFTVKSHVKLLVLIHFPQLLSPNQHHCHHLCWNRKTLALGEPSDTRPLAKHPMGFISHNPPGVFWSPS